MDPKDEQPQVFSFKSNLQVTLPHLIIIFFRYFSHQTLSKMTTYPHNKADPSVCRNTYKELRNMRDASRLSFQPLQPENERSQRRNKVKSGREKRSQRSSKVKSGFE